MKTKNLFKNLVILGILSTLFIQLSCLTFRHRPRRLLNEAVSQHKTFDALIVPGVPFYGEAWDSTMKARVLWSTVLFKQGLAKNIIYSGGAVYSPYYEAKIMGLYAIELGVPEQNIYYDTSAEHSTENIYFSYELARRLGFKTLALATDPGQSALLKRFTRKRFGTPIHHLPFVEDTLWKYNHLEPTINPESAKVQDFTSITTRETFWKRLGGTIGKNIPWSDMDTKKADSL